VTAGSGGAGRGLDLRLLLIADLGPDGFADAARVEAAVRGGVTALQVRGKETGAGALVAAARVMLPLCRRAGIALFVNDRVDAALAAGADGVQVGPDDLPPEDVRRVAGSLRLGVSARTRERVAAAERAGADFLGCGALRSTSTKPEAPVIGVAGIAALAAVTRLPVVAVGGVAPADLPALRAAGVAGVAVASGILAAPDPEAAARAYRSAWEAADR
jgi:thiamine-phosphate pyrophosphorylase